MTDLAKKNNVSDQQLEKMITDKHINAASTFLENWEEVANQLEVDKLKIDEIQKAPGISNVTRNHRYLTAWKNAEYEQVAYRKLVEALDELKQSKKSL